MTLICEFMPIFAADYVFDFKYGMNSRINLKKF